jgi:hypothetical protein
MTMEALRLTACALMSGSLAGLAGCAQTEAAAPADQGPSPDYLGAEAAQLKDDLVQVKVQLEGARSQADVDDYARCAASGFALAGGAGFVRHVRTLNGKEGGIWSADAVYSVTPELPEGLETIDAEVTADDCRDRGIPTE